MAPQTRGLLSDRELFAQLADQYRNAYSKVENAFPGLDFDQPPLVDFVELIEVSAENNLSISRDDLYNRGLQQEMEVYSGYGSRNLPVVIGPERVQQIKAEIDMAREFQAQFTKTQRNRLMGIAPNNLNLTQDQAKALQDQFGIADADKKGLSIKEAQHLQEILYQSEEFAKFGVEPQELKKAIEWHERANVDITLESLQNLLPGRNPIKITNQQAKDLLDIHTGLDQDRVLGEETVQILKDLADNHLKVNELGLKDPKALQTTLSKQSKAFDRFTNHDKNHGTLTRELIRHHGIHADSISFLQSHADFHQHNQLGELDAGLTGMRELLADYDKYEPILRHLFNIPSKEAAEQLLRQLNQYEAVKPHLDQVDLQALNQLTGQRTTQQDGLRPQELQQLGITDPHVFNQAARTWDDAVQQGRAYGVEPLQPGQIDAVQVLQDPEQAQNAILNYAAQQGLDQDQIDAMFQAAQQMQPAPTRNPTPTPTPAHQSSFDLPKASAGSRLAGFVKRSFAGTNENYLPKAEAEYRAQQQRYADLENQGFHPITLAAFEEKVENAKYQFELAKGKEARKDLKQTFKKADINKTDQEVVLSELAAEGFIVKNRALGFIPRSKRSAIRKTLKQAKTEGQAQVAKNIIEKVENVRAMAGP